MHHPSQAQSTVKRLQSHLVSPFVATFLSLILFALANTASALEQNTVFLPLKINAANSASVGQRVDLALEGALRDKGLLMLSRLEATEQVDYNGPWPPSAAVLSQVAENAGLDYVAVGSLTMLGEHISVDMQVIDLLKPETPHSSFREGNSLSEIHSVLNDTLVDILSYTNRNFIIAKIIPEGNKRIDSGAIRRKISTKPGDTYSPDNLRKDLKQVFSMGYFDNVEIEVNDSGEGKEVIFRVEEKPLIKSVSFTGLDKVQEEDVRDAANIKTNNILNPAKLNDAVKRINGLYRSKGYYAARSKFALEHPSENSVDVQFIINEGDKMSISGIRFVGNEAFTDEELQDEIQTSTWKWYSSWLTESGTLKQDVLEQDAARLAAFYNNQGFIEAKVGEPEVEEAGEDLYLTFTVQEGPRYQVGTVEVEGDLVEDKDKMINLLQIRKQRFLNKKILRDDVTKLTDLYAEHGYAFANVRPKIDKSATGKRVNINFQIDKGELVKFNRVKIQGNTRTRDNVIRRDLAVKEGGVYDSKAIRTSTNRLQRLGYFEDVSVIPQETMNNDQMDVMVAVKEKPTGQFSVGAGYSSSDKLMFMGEISEDNFLGLGTRLSFAANLSAVSNKFNLSYTDPRLFDSNVSAGIDAFNWEREYTDYTKGATGGGLRFGHHLVEKWRIYYGYTWTDTELSDISEDASDYILESAKINITSAVRLSFVRDTRDRRFNANSGSKHSLSIKYAGGPLGGEAAYTKLEAYTSWFFPMPLDLVFHTKLAAGQAFENEDGKLPVYDNFYLGGMNSIRGFKSSSVSPIDPTNDEKYGGDKMWFSNFEIFFPLLSDAGVRGVAFLDFGNVYDMDDDWDFGNIKKSTGLGINWLSPMGPLRLIWGYNLDSQEGDEDAQWDFAMGGSF
ncbi:MAG: outer membrane protein assembly factor BamA [Candidatus Electrothrix aestuarii]|uniref:Outer membrane protein assembly factor BamA n=1 Tax=Candidatus Electrothrix aestuarii TaxID=3062594 RepID=A0AAU8M0A4_9BACT|nr:outer membrane protein assembly factor BamA [Candidatus Electrothrix aestuarii]